MDLERNSSYFLRVSSSIRTSIEVDGWTHLPLPLIPEIKTVECLSRSSSVKMFPVERKFFQRSLVKIKDMEFLY